MENNLENKAVSHEEYFEWSTRRIEEYNNILAATKPIRWEEISQDSQTSAPRSSSAFSLHRRDSSRSNTESSIYSLRSSLFSSNLEDKYIEVMLENFQKGIITFVQEHELKFTELGQKISDDHEQRLKLLEKGITTFVQEHELKFTELGQKISDDHEQRLKLLENYYKHGREDLTEDGTTGTTKLNLFTYKFLAVLIFPFFLYKFVSFFTNQKQQKL
jgi:hypothetical protein